MRECPPARAAPFGARCLVAHAGGVPHVSRACRRSR